mgnify:FL=1
MDRKPGQDFRLNKNNQEFVKNNQESLDGSCIYFYNNKVYGKNKDKDQ